MVGRARASLRILAGSHREDDLVLLALVPLTFALLGPLLLLVGITTGILPIDRWDTSLRYLGMLASGSTFACHLYFAWRRLNGLTTALSALGFGDYHEDIEPALVEGLVTTDPAIRAGIDEQEQDQADQETVRAEGTQSQDASQQEQSKDLQQRNQELEERHRVLGEEIRHLQIQKDDIQGQHQELKEQTKLLKEEEKELRKKNDETQELYHGLKMEEKRLEQKNQRLRKENDELEEQKKVLEEEKQDVQKSKEDMKKWKERLDKRDQDLQKEKSDMEWTKHKLEVRELEVKEQEQELQERVQELERRERDHQKKKDDMQGRKKMWDGQDRNLQGGEQEVERENEEEYGKVISEPNMAARNLWNGTIKPQVRSTQEENTEQEKTEENQKLFINMIFYALQRLMQGLYFSGPKRFYSVVWVVGAARGNPRGQSRTLDGAMQSDHHIQGISDHYCTAEDGRSTQREIADGFIYGETLHNRPVLVLLDRVDESKPEPLFDPNPNMVACTALSDVLQVAREHEFRHRQCQGGLSNYPPWSEHLANHPDPDHKGKGKAHAARRLNIQSTRQIRVSFLEIATDGLGTGREKYIMKDLLRGNPHDKGYTVWNCEEGEGSHSSMGTRLEYQHIVDVKRGTPKEVVKSLQRLIGTAAKLSRREKSNAAPGERKVGVTLHIREYVPGARAGTGANVQLVSIASQDCKFAEKHLNYLTKYVGDPGWAEQDYDADDLMLTVDMMKQRPKILYLPAIQAGLLQNDREPRAAAITFIENCVDAQRPSPSQQAAAAPQQATTAPQSTRSVLSSMLGYPTHS